MNPAAEIKRLLKNDGAVLLRKNKHQIWKLSTGQRFVCPVSGSDCRGARNALASLKKCLGIGKKE